MDLRSLCEQVAAAETVVAVGGGTHREVGGPCPEGVEVRAPGGVLAYDPAELTVTVGAGTTVEELSEVLGAAGQECPLDPRQPREATVGGTLATGLSGRRRLRYGPLRDCVLEARFVTADGRVVKGGGPTVKNVTGYDLPRLLVGSLGTIGVLAQVTLRCQPRPESPRWFTTTGDPFETRRRLFRPSCISWDGRTTRVLLEGDAGDVAAEVRAAGLDPAEGPPPFPSAPHRGRLAIAPGRLRDLASTLRDVAGLRWLAEVGVGTVHAAAADASALAAARRVAHDAGGWLLREEGGDGLDGFGRTLPNVAVMTRLKEAFDPTRKLSPGRLPL